MEREKENTRHIALSLQCEGFRWQIWERKECLKSIAHKVAREHGDVGELEHGGSDLVSSSELGKLARFSIN